MRLHLLAVLIPVILEISSMPLNCEASRVLFLNQTLLQIENYIKMDNLPSNAMFRYVLIFSEQILVALLYRLFECDCET